ncbi:MAG: GNAT family N-acetyltransferase [Alphaproteobacteria bacterium]
MVDLVIPSVKYKDTFIAAVKELKKQTGFVSPSVQQYADYDLNKLQNNFEDYIVKPLIDTMNGVNLPDGFVPATEFWIIKNEKFAGRICLRHSLTDFMEKYIGHIGHMVIPSMRNQGIAKYALKLVLKKATAKKIKQVLLICEDDNLISKHIIEKFVQRFGGYQDTSTERKGVKMLRYWITTPLE